MRKTLRNSVILLTTAFIALTAGPAGAALVLGDAVYPYSTQSQPAKGASYVDSTYGVTVTRMTSSAADTGRWGTQVEYSTWDPESSDGKYVLVQTLSDLNNAGSYVVYTRATNSVYRTLTFQNSNGQNEEPRWDRSGSHPAWLYYRSNKQLRYIDVADGSDHLVRDFSADFPSYDTSYYIWNGDEGSCSADARYWGFMLGSGNAGMAKLFTYDKQTNTIVGTLDATGRSINSVSMSPSGQYIYVAFDFDGSGTYHDRPHIFKNNFTSPVQACTTIPHGSWAYDKQGREVYVYLNAFPDEDVIGFVRADTGQTYKVYPQSLLGWSGANVNFSAPGIIRKGWALCSEYSDSGYGYWSDNQIYMVELDETKVYGGATPPRIVRLGPTQTYTGSNYYYQQPNATINTAGTRVYFSANWRNVNGNEEVYRIDLPATWYEELGGTVGASEAMGSGTFIGDVKVVGLGEMRVVGSTARRGLINPDEGDTAKIFFEGSRIGTYECSIFDLNGNRVFQESKSSLRMGMFEWAPRDVASGGYIAVITGPGFKESKKFVVVR